MALFSFGWDRPANQSAWFWLGWDSQPPGLTQLRLGGHPAGHAAGGPADRLDHQIPHLVRIPIPNGVTNATGKKFNSSSSSSRLDSHRLRSVSAVLSQPTSRLRLAWPVDQLPRLGWDLGLGFAQLAAAQQTLAWASGLLSSTWVSSQNNIYCFPNYANSRFNWMLTHMPIYIIK